MEESGRMTGGWLKQGARAKNAREDRDDRDEAG